MSIDSLYSDGIDESVSRDLRNPAPAPQQSFSTFSFLGAGLRGPAAAANETTGSVADALSSFGQTLAATGGSAGGMFSTPSPKEQEQEKQARERMLAGYLNTEAGNLFRNVALDYAPDPETSHTADQLLFGLTRFASKAVADVATFGPVGGAVALALDEGNTTAQNLMMKGVDTGTAAKVGAVTGAISGVGSVLPIGGSTVARTLGLTAIGGPGAFIAQETLARDILQKQYPTEAAIHDPLDPLGLILSAAVPGAFGALHLRGVKGRAKTVESGGIALDQMTPDERVKLKYNAPSLDAYAVQAAEREGVPPALLLAIKNAGEKSNPNQVSPRGAKGVMQFMDATWAEVGKGDPRDPMNSIDAGARYLRKLHDAYGSWDAAVAHYNGGGSQAALVRSGSRPSFKETADYLDRVKAYVGEDIATTAAKSPEVLDAARVRVLDDTVRESLPDRPAAYSEVLKASDDIGAGIVHENLAPPARVTELPQFKSWFGESKVVDEAGQPMVLYHGTADSIESFDQGRAGLIFLSPEPEFASSYAASRADARAGYPDTPETAPEGVNGANVMPVFVKAENIFDATTMAYKDVETPEFIADLKARGFDAVRVKEMGVENVAVFEPTQIKSAVGNSGKFDPKNPSLTDPLQPGDQPIRWREPDNALPDPSSPTLVPEVPAVKSDAGGSSGGETKGPEAQLTARLLQENPEMLVTLPETGERLTLAKALEQMKEDAEFEAKEADLYKAAVECALLNGT